MGRWQSGATHFAVPTLFRNKRFMVDEMTRAFIKVKNKIARNEKNGKSNFGFSHIKYG